MKNEIEIRIIANFTTKGKRKQFVEEMKQTIHGVPRKSDSDKFSRIVKKMFEESLYRTAVVKTRVSRNKITLKVDIRPHPEDKQNTRQ